MCIDGTCDCPAGYEGDNCEIISRNKFIGVWSVSEICGSGNYSYNLTITANATGITIVNLQNLYDGQEIIQGTVNGSVITIGPQTTAQATYVGSGTINNNVLTISFTISVGSDSDSCTITATT